MSIIEVKDVSKVYGFGDAATVALDEVSLKIEKAEFVAIMGPSGSGKTTLLNIIGLLDSPSHGVYKIDGRFAARLRPSQTAKVRRDHIGFVFQDYNLLPKLTIIDNVALPLAYKGTPPVRRLKRASAALERVGLRDREYYYPGQLSGGQMQRAAIARALVNDPNVIIADEPTGNLDSTNTRIVMELLADIHNTGNTVLMVTHNPELTRYASRVIYMYDGAIVYDEASKVGTIPDAALKAMRAIRMRREQEENILAGVSAMMQTIPEVPAPARPRAKRRSSKKHPKIVQRKRRSTVHSSGKKRVVK